MMTLFDRLNGVRIRTHAIKAAIGETSAHISDETATLLPESLFAAWQPDKLYDIVGEVVVYEGVRYRIAQAHTSQANWLPSDVPALYGKLTFEGGVQVWERPQAHNVIMKGERRLFRTEDGFDGNVYESLIDNNSWSYVEYSQGWKMV